MELCGICGVHLESMGECKVHCPTYKCQCALGWTAAVPYDTSRLWFPSHSLAASDSSPICIRLLQQVHGSCSFYSVHVVNFICPCIFPSFLPSYSDWVQVHVSCLSLFQFYGCRYPRAPVFVVSLFLFAGAETQQCISMTTQDNTIPPETKESPSPTILLNIQKIPASSQHSEKLKSLTSIHDPCKSSDHKILGQNNDNNVQQK